MSWGSARLMTSDSAIGPPGPTSQPPSSASSRRRSARRTYDGVAGAVASSSITTGSSAKPMATSPRLLEPPHPGLGGAVGVHRGVPVLVVLGEVQPHRGVGPEARRSRRAGSWCTRRRTRRRRRRARRRVACRCCRRRSPVARRRATSRPPCSVVVVLPSVPVTASIGRGPPGPALLPLEGEVDLAAHRDPGADRRGQHRMRLGHTRARGDQVAPVEQPASSVGVGPDDVARHPSRAAATRRPRRSAVVGDDRPSQPRRSKARAVASPATPKP